MKESSAITNRAFEPYLTPARRKDRIRLYPLQRPRSRVNIYSAAWGSFRRGPSRARRARPYPSRRSSASSPRPAPLPAEDLPNEGQAAPSLLAHRQRRRASLPAARISRRSSPAGCSLPSHMDGPSAERPSKACQNRGPRRARGGPSRPLSPLLGSPPRPSLAPELPLFSGPESRGREPSKRPSRPLHSAPRPSLREPLPRVVLKKMRGPVIFDGQIRNTPSAGIDTRHTRMGSDSRDRKSGRSPYSAHMHHRAVRQFTLHALGWASSCRFC